MDIRPSAMQSRRPQQGHDSIDASKYPVHMYVARVHTALPRNPTPSQYTHPIISQPCLTLYTPAPSCCSHTTLLLTAGKGLGLQEHWQQHLQEVALPGQPEFHRLAVIWEQGVGSCAAQGGLAARWEQGAGSCAAQG